MLAATCHFLNLCYALIISILRQPSATIVDAAGKHCSACRGVMKERKFSVTEEQRRQVLQYFQARRVTSKKTV